MEFLNLNNILGRDEIENKLIGFLNHFEMSQNFYLGNVLISKVYLTVRNSNFLCQKLWS